jgi:hypothetical protein
MLPKAKLYLVKKPNFVLFCGINYIFLGNFEKNMVDLPSFWY